VNKLLASRELVYIPVLGQAIVGESGANAAHDLGLELAHPQVLGKVPMPHEQFIEDHAKRVHIYTAVTQIEQGGHHTTVASEAGC
jgi:hypothetical protein